MFLWNIAPFLLFALAAARPYLKLIQRNTTGDQYTIYSGDGSTTAGWPSVDQWIDFETMFTNNQPHMLSSCGYWGVENNSPDEVSMINGAIQQLSQTTGVDNRFILAIIMQESGGCVRAPTTNYGVTNPGLMQSHDGSGTCNPSSESAITPCPQTEITQMITDGTSGTSSGEGLRTILSPFGDDAQSYYKTARVYNSGSIDPSGNLEAGGSTHCYSSDIANRLTGWFSAPTKCTY